MQETHQVTAAPHPVLAVSSKTPFGCGFGAGISDGKSQKRPHPAIGVLESSEGGVILLQAAAARQRPLP
jgi:hypothetical protein